MHPFPLQPFLPSLRERDPCPQPFPRSLLIVHAYGRCPGREYVAPGSPFVPEGVFDGFEGGHPGAEGGFEVVPGVGFEADGGVHF